MNLLQASVKPRCGRLVGFSSGGENPHGVKAITSGQRCAVALWFTLDPLYRELVSHFFNPRALRTVFIRRIHQLNCRVKIKTEMLTK